jgi:hypothetical protein
MKIFSHWRNRRWDFKDLARGFGMTPWEYRVRIWKRKYRNVIKKLTFKKH